MTDEEIAALLASPVGRRMVEAAMEALVAGADADQRDSIAAFARGKRQRSEDTTMEECLAAALREATNTTCPTCHGKGTTTVEHPYGVSDYECPNPDCKDGKVLPALGRVGPGTPHARMFATWERMGEDEQELVRLVGYSPFSSMYPIELAYVDAFRKLAKPDGSSR